jgi:hypothetical protein
VPTTTKCPIYRYFVSYDRLRTQTIPYTRCGGGRKGCSGDCADPGRGRWRHHQRRVHGPFSGRGLRTLHRAKPGTQVRHRGGARSVRQTAALTAGGAAVCPGPMPLVRSVARPTDKQRRCRAVLASASGRRGSGRPRTFPRLVRCPFHSAELREWPCDPPSYGSRRRQWPATCPAA